jgi:hypothetical protein
MFHDLLEGYIVLLEFFALLFQLLLDILISDEDALEIHPLLLHLQPYLNALGNQIQTALPVADFGVECSCVFA